MARQMGALGVLVLSGGTSRSEVPGLPDSDRPDFVVNHVGALVEALKSIQPGGNND
jgi:hypothetical protein